MLSTGLLFALVPVAVFALMVVRSMHAIGPAELGLVNKRLARRRLDSGDPIAFHGEAGNQADLLMPGMRMKLWPLPGAQTPLGADSRR